MWVGGWGVGTCVRACDARCVKSNDNLCLVDARLPLSVTLLFTLVALPCVACFVAFCVSLDVGLPRSARRSTPS